MPSLAKFKLYLILASLLGLATNAPEKGAKSSILYGKHHIICGVNSVSGIISTRNASGHVISARGVPVSMLEWLSFKYNFTFSYLATNATAIDSTPTEIGLIEFLANRSCDIALPVVPTYSRTIFLDYTHPYLYIPVSYVIPFGETFADIWAIFKPFQLWVWVVGALGITSLTLTFYGVNAVYRSVSRANYALRDVSRYVLEVTLGQGGFCTSARHPIRLAAVALCCAACVCILSYNSVLIAFLTSPNPNLLIEKIEDLKDQTDVKLVTDRGVSTEARLLSSDVGLLKVLGDKLRSYPKSRCNTTQQCVNLVKSGLHVYTAGLDTYLTKAMRDDYVLAKKCNLRLGKRSYMNLDLSWGVAKRNPIAKDLTLGIMRMREAGLISMWKKPFEADASKCIAQAAERPAYPRLSVLQLTGAFLLLFSGCTISFVVFMLERYR